MAAGFPVHSFLFSIVLGLMRTLAAMILGSLAAIGLHRHRFLGRVAPQLLMSPLVPRPSSLASRCCSFTTSSTRTRRSSVC
jgi:ABC-type spermidine/putrescine transport system permease subunit II